MKDPSAIHPSQAEMKKEKKENIKWNERSWCSLYEGRKITKSIFSSLSCLIVASLPFFAIVAGTFISRWMDGIHFPPSRNFLPLFLLMNFKWRRENSKRSKKIMLDGFWAHKNHSMSCKEGNYKKFLLRISKWNIFF